uniref:hypothetical protein n=1 Tax=Methanobrevibacter sp. TaxID=66852 RepID=UPI003865CADA
MTIASEIQRIKTNIANAYDALENKGATMPATEDSANLASTVNTVSTGGTIESLSITPSTSAQTITATGGVDGYSPINVSAVTSSIDANIVAGNIKDGVSILGVNGTLTSGDEITATNTTGSVVSADDRVWVEPEDVYTPNYTVKSSPTITDKILSNVTQTKYLYNYTGENSYSINSMEFCIKIKANWSQSTINVTSYSTLAGIFGTSSNTVVIGNKQSFTFWNNKHFVFGQADGIGVDFGLYSDFSDDTWYWFKGITTKKSNIEWDFEGFVSTDGVNWTQKTNTNYTSLNPFRDTTSDTNKNIILANGIVTGSNGVLKGLMYDLSECYIKMDGELFWTPYTKTGTNYSIINDTDITSTSFTGIAQANIANNASGTVKTLLDGNGSYAPTTATKSITTNGTYTASAENAYGLSSVTVNVPTPDTWYNWRTAITYSPDFSFTSYYGTNNVNDTSRQINCTSSGYQINCRIKKSEITPPTSSLEVCMKIRQSFIFSGYSGYCGCFGNPDIGLSEITTGAHLRIASGRAVWNIQNSTNYYASNDTISTNTWYWFKLIATGSEIISSVSMDGINWTTVYSDNIGINFSNLTLYDNVKFGFTGSTNNNNTDTVDIDLSECYVKIDGTTVWTPYIAGPYSECYTLTASPTTSTQVYEIPKKTSALTITAVGTDTITLSDTKVYNRNSVGDVESPVLGTKTITSNDTYTAASDYLDGFSSVTVDVPSAPTKKYNLLDRVKDDSNNEIGTVSGFFTDANNVEYAVVCLDAQYR